MKPWTRADALRDAAAQQSEHNDAMASEARGDCDGHGRVIGVQWYDADEVPEREELL